jgi:arylformamidase
MIYSYLSYFIDEQTPQYGGQDNISVNKLGEISKGASANSTHVDFPNHIGTHVDFPLHFSDSGNSINNYSPEFWVFNKVHLSHYTAGDDEIIDESKLNLEVIPETTDLLLIRTGFGLYRGQHKYWRNNPGLSPTLATKLKVRCPNLRAIGFDFISLSSYQNRELGRLAHKEFLIKNDILIIEDMKLMSLGDNRIKTVTALPLLIRNIDGAPITVIAGCSND